MTTNANGIQYTVSFNGTNVPQVENVSTTGHETEFFTAKYIGDTVELMRPTIQKSVKLTLTCGYDPAQQGFLLAAMNASPVTSGAVVLVCPASPDGAVIQQTFTWTHGYVATYKVVGGTVSDQGKLEVVLQTSGSYTVS